MRGGDISNEVPMRVIVTLDCILDRKPEMKKVLGIPVFKEEVTYNRRALSYIPERGLRYGGKFIDLGRINSGS
jgi:hypothetical protein